MDNSIIQQIKEEFDNSKSTPHTNHNEVKGSVVCEKISKGRLFNIIPFEIESDGFKKGRMLKSSPQDMKGVVMYGINKSDEIVLIEEYGTISNPYREYFYYSENLIKGYRYNTTGHLICVKYVILYNGKIQDVYHHAEYGFSHQEYLYDNEMLTKVISQENEHDKNDFLTREINYYYDSNNNLCLIEQDNLNGYIQELYPKLGTWRTASKGNNNK